MCTSAIRGQVSSCGRVLCDKRNPATISKIGARQTYVHWLNQFTGRERVILFFQGKAFIARSSVEIHAGPAVYFSCSANKTLSLSWSIILSQTSLVHSLTTCLSKIPHNVLISSSVFYRAIFQEVSPSDYRLFTLAPVQLLLVSEPYTPTIPFLIVCCQHYQHGYHTNLYI